MNTHTHPPSHLHAHFSPVLVNRLWVFSLRSWWKIGPSFRSTPTSRQLSFSKCVHPLSIELTTSKDHPTLTHIWRTHNPMNRLQSKAISIYMSLKSTVAPCWTCHGNNKVNKVCPEMADSSYLLSFCSLKINLCCNVPRQINAEEFKFK